MSTSSTFSSVSSSQAKHWIFTLNNYTADDIIRIQGCASATYLVFGKEVGESGTQHLQGYVAFATRKRLTQVRAFIATRAHFEVARGTPAQASDYCKKDGDYWERGDLPEPKGTRNDIKALQREIEAGTTVKKVEEEYFGLYLRYRTSLLASIREHQSERNWVPEVRVLWGPPGSGKSRRVHELEDSATLYVHPGGSWFDGYDAHEACLFDDFGGSEFKLTYLLKLLDRYPMKVPIKGGFVNWAPKRIWLTSNLGLEQWYPNILPVHQEALERRITSKEYLGLQ